MLGNWLLRLRHKTPRLRGKGAFFRALDGHFGPFRAEAGQACVLPVYSSSLQDELLVNADSRSSAGHPIHDLFNRLGEGDVFLDIGANTGLFSVLASRKVGQSGAVVALEPSRREFDRLLKTLQWNDCRNVQPFKLAAADAAGRLSLSIASEHSGRNSIWLENSGECETTTEAVHAVRVDSLIQCILPDREIALCKMDIEGSEVRAIVGMANLFARRLIRCVCIEVDVALLANAGSSKNELYEVTPVRF